MSLTDCSVLVRNVGQTPAPLLKDAFTKFGEVKNIVWKVDQLGNRIDSAIIVLDSQPNAQTALKTTTLEPWILSVVDVDADTLGKMIDNQAMEDLFVKTFSGLPPVSRQRAMKQILEVGAGDTLAKMEPDTLDPLTQKMGLYPKIEEKEPMTFGNHSDYRHKAPRLPVFSGESKDSTFARWQYQVKVLQKGPYDQFTLLEAIHTSLRSPAADTILTMGPTASVDDIVHKLRTMYGCVSSEEALTEKLYQLKQEKEGITSWAFRVEEAVFLLEDKGGINHSDVPSKVKGRFWYGLADIHIKDATRSSYQQMNFDDLLVMCRTLEEEYGPTATSKLSAKIHQQTPSPVEDKLDKILKHMESLDVRVKALETAVRNPVKKNEEQKPKVVKCTKCHQEGHLWYGCKKGTDIVCNKCHKTGHLQNCCKELN